MIKARHIIIIIISIFMLSIVSMSGYAANPGDESDDDFFEEEFDEDEFDEDDDFPGLDDEEDMMPPAKKEVKKAVKKKEVKKTEKKEVKKEAKKEKAVKKEDIPDFDEDDDLFDFDEDEGVEAGEEEEVEAAAPKQEIPEEEITFKVYEAKKGDTLYTIAEKFYSDSYRWEEIWKYNKYIKAPTALYLGDSVIVPVRKIKIEEEVKFLPWLKP